MIIGELYNEMFDRELTGSMRNFSEHWAGRSHNWASTCWERPLPAETAIYLRRRLLAEGHPDLAAKVLLALLGEEQHAQ
jgi:hypothetical protein